MRNVILIISYGRPNCITVQALKDSGYDGEWYIVCDDTDGTDYEGLYQGHVIRFSRQKYIDCVDVGDNFKNNDKGRSVYARNACFDIAREMQVDCFGLFDDDFHIINYRWIQGKSLKCVRCKQLARIFNDYCKFIVESDFACGGFIGAGRLLGGAQSVLGKNKFWYNPTNAYIINMHKKQFQFVGGQYEDAIYSYLNNSVGNIAAAFLPISVNMVSPESMHDKGGCTAMYENGGSSYIAGCYCQMFIPSFFKWNTRGGMMKVSTTQNVPKIISGKWQKKDA